MQADAGRRDALHADLGGDLRVVGDVDDGVVQRLQRRDAFRPLLPLRSEDRAVHRIRAAGAYGIDRESWIDNSTDPVTVWYVDHEGWITRIQSLD